MIITIFWNITIMKSYNGIIMGFRNHGVSPSHYGSSILKWSNDLDVFGGHDLGNPQMMISWFSFFHFLFKHIMVRKYCFSPMDKLCGHARFQRFFTLKMMVSRRFKHIDVTSSSTLFLRFFGG